MNAVTTPLATFIIATYRRPETLDATLRALRLQHDGDFEAVVVGDCCDDRTEAVIRAIDDPRVRYYNLPSRYGEQGGPNSVGLAVAHGDLVTFLNHDDLLLPDHLAQVRVAFDRSDIDVLSRRFAYIGAPGDDPGDPFPVVACRPHCMRTSRLMTSRMWETEPSSAWTIRADVARRTGPWPSSQSIIRWPFQEWLLRLARTTRRWRFDTTITGLTADTRSGRYVDDVDDATPLLRLLIESSPDDLRDRLTPTDRTSLRSEPTNRRTRLSWWIDNLVSPFGLEIYRRTGLDYGPQPARLRGIDAGGMARDLLRSRTGETMPDHSRLDDLLADPESVRII